MKDLSLLIWLSQLGFSVAFPLAGFILLAVWLRDNQGWGSWVLWVGIILGVICASNLINHSDQKDFGAGWGSWVLWVGIILGVICAFQGLRSAIRSMELLSKSKKQKDDQPPPVGFNDHH